MISPMRYPTDREGKCFAQKAIRRMLRAGVANELGTNVFALLTVVATTEDSKHYRGAPTFFNTQLMLLLGIKKLDTLISVRNIAIANGWLHYESSGIGKHLPGKYWVLIPKQYAGLDDSSIDESERETPPEVPLPENGSGSGIGLGNLAPDPSQQTGAVMGSVAGAVMGDILPVPVPKRESHSDSHPSLSELVAKWNQIPGVTHCRKATTKRQDAYKARCRDASWLADVDSALERIAASPFCRGESDRGWTADIDWFLKPDSLTKILEGKYDDKRANSTAKPKPSTADLYPLLTPPE